MRSVIYTNNKSVTNAIMDMSALKLLIRLKKSHLINVDPDILALRVWDFFARYRDVDRPPGTHALPVTFLFK